MAQQTTTKKKFDFASYGIVVAFLCLEVLAFLGFSLGHNYILYGSLSIALVLLLLLVTFRQIKKDGIASYAFFLFPIFIYGLLSALSNFVTMSDGAIGIANGIFIPIALTCFSLSGYLVTNAKGFDIQKALLVIYGSLAVFVLINLIATMIYYVPFYTLIYKDYYIFYDGKPSPVSIDKTAYMLFGFQITEVNIRYWTLFPTLLFTSIIALFFIKYKENKKVFLIYVAYAAIAFISLLFTITKYSLITNFLLLVVIAGVLVYAKIPQSRKIIKYAVYVFLGLFAVASLVLFINAQSWSWTASFRNIIANNALLNRLFNTNFLASGIYMILWECLNPGKIFGSFVGVVEGTGYGINQQLSGSWMFDNVLTSGIFGAIFFAFALFIGIRQMMKYYHNSKDLDVNKNLILGFVIALFVVCGILYEGIPLINSNNLFPIYMFAPFLIALFLISYTFKEEKAEEVKAEVKEEKQYEETISL